MSRSISHNLVSIAKSLIFWSSLFAFISEILTLALLFPQREGPPTISLSSGILFAFLVAAPFRLNIPVILSATAARFLAASLLNEWKYTPMVLPLSITSACVYAGGAILFNRLSRNFSLNLLGYWLVFIFLGGILVPAVGGGLAACFVSVSREEPFGLWNWYHYAVCKSLGIMAISPIGLVILHSSKELSKAHVRKERVINMVAFGASFAMASLGFVNGLPHSQYLGPYLVFSSLVWIAARGSIPLVVASNSIISIFAAACTLRGYGPFALFSIDPLESLIALQLFLGVSLISQILMCALVQSRREMAEKVADLYREKARLHEDEKQWLESVLNAIPSPLCLVDTDTGFPTYENTAAKHIAGTPRAAGGFPDIRLTDKQGDPIEFSDFPHARLARGEKVEDLELNLSSPAGKFTLLISAVNLSPMYGHKSTSVISFRDISRLRAAEEKLSRINRGLAGFTSIASHDLQEPIRTISSYLRLLKVRAGEGLGKDAREFIDYAVDATNRMRNLINQLLEYAKAGESTNRRQWVDCNKVVSNVLQDIETAIREKSAVLDIPPLPKIWGDEMQINQVFQNLILNALKYNEHPAPTVSLGFQYKGDLIEFSVKDNGIGINPEDQARIFEPFQRLHGRAQYSGTGLGLAVCRTIIEAHGGQLRVESKPKEGSTFYFSFRFNQEISNEGPRKINGLIELVSDASGSNSA